MANIVLTNHCNRKCSYCFARGRVADNPDKSHNLKPAELEYIIDFFKKSQINEFSLLGGEPTLHPEFIPLGQKVLAEGFNLNIFTNGLIADNVLDFLDQIDEERLNILVNINHPDDMSKAQWYKICQTFKALGKRVGLGFNIYKLGLKFDFMLDLIYKYNLRKYIRLSVSQPILKAPNSHLLLTDYSQLASSIVDFAVKCDKADVKIAFDCGFIMCMFDELQLGKLYTYNVLLGFYCAPAIDISPGLDAWYCFPLSYMYNQKLTDYNNYRQLTDFYKQKFSPFNLFCGLQKCRSCKYRRRGQCNGGCLAHKMRIFRMG